MRVALVSMPWPIFSRPSVQLGVLKGYLKAVWPGLEVRNFHPYLRLAAALGYDLYQRLSETSWLAEGICGALLFPERRGETVAFLRGLARRQGVDQDLDGLVSRVEEALAAYLSAVDWGRFRAVGFSVCLNQLTSSLWAAKWIKERWPDLPVILGGSGCAEDMGRGLLAAFPFVDFVINGEGERPLAALLRHLLLGEPAPARGVFRRRGAEIVGQGVDQLPPEEIPSPDYGDYLREVSALPADRRFFPLITLEASRGCWWFKCRFCNLNLQWRGFRRKPLERVLREVRAHARAGLLDFAFVDNCLAVEDSRRLFASLARDGVDYRIFAELRAVYSREDYHLFARGGLTWVQIGIEALSTPLLARLNKGTTAMDNVAAMRHCAEAGLRLEGNLILEFPGSTPEEVDETLEALDFVFPFRPLTTVSFWLGYGSPVFRRPRDFGLRALWPHPHYRRLFPGEVLARLVPLAWSWRGDRRLQARLWRPVREKVARWRELHRRLGREKGPLLAYRDGGRFLLVRQVLPSGEVLHHRLTGVSREVYLFLADVRSFAELKDRFPGLAAERLRSFLEDLRRKRLVFREGERWLSLAIRCKGEL